MFACHHRLESEMGKRDGQKQSREPSSSDYYIVWHGLAGARTGSGSAQVLQGDAKRESSRRAPMKSLFVKFYLLVRVRVSYLWH